MVEFQSSTRDAYSAQPHLVVVHVDQPAVDSQQRFAKADGHVMVQIVTLAAVQVVRILLQRENDVAWSHALRKSRYCLYKGID